MYDADHPARALPPLAETVARIDDLTARPAVSPAIASRIALDAAHAAYQAGRAAAIAELVTTEQAAALLGVTERTVRDHATRHGIGWQISRGTWLFRPEDIAQVRALGRGQRATAERAPVERPPSNADARRGELAALLASAPETALSAQDRADLAAYLAGASYGELAERHGVSRTRIGQRMKRAEARLRGAIRRQYPEPPRPWTDADDAMLRSRPDAPVAELAEALGRSRGAIKGRRSWLRAHGRMAALGGENDAA